MTITHTNSNNSHTPEFKRASLEKRKEVINIPTKAEERPMIQISFRTQDQHVKIGTIRIRAKIHSWSTIHGALKKSTNPLDLLQKSTIRAHFKAKSVDPKIASPPLQ